jgi:hypothetical protein|tara:strand:- start:498 stop:746 length:249 start_codon:yes stop_codon:yes gene_type:complete
MPKQKYNIGDLVEIVEIAESTAYFPWAKPPVPGIYLGLLETTLHLGPAKEEKTTCYKVWSLGKVRYVSTLEELKLLSSISDV